jgi:para-nitrobenzyl esterase
MRGSFCGHWPAGLRLWRPFAGQVASGAHRDVDVLLSFASDDMGWWVANDLDRFDPHTVAGVVDEFAGWRFPRSRAQQVVGAYDQGGRTPAEVRAAFLTDYIFALPAAPWPTPLRAATPISW